MQKDDERGFTLVETLVAFAILSAGLAALIGAASTGILAETRAAEREHALIEARSALHRVGADVPLVAGTQEIGRVRLEITETVAADERLPALYAVTAAVRDTGVVLTTLRTGAGQ